MSDDVAGDSKRQAVAEPKRQTVAERDDRSVAEPNSRAVAEPNGRTVGETDRRTVAEPDPDTVPDVEVLVVDNYDSFAYNLVQYVGELAGSVIVRRNDAIDVDGIRELGPDGVVVSPGPGRPEDAGVSTSLFAEADLPVLGVCLGHQALCAANGASVELAPDVVHGKPSTIETDGQGLYAHLPERLRVGRYHSLAVERSELPADLVETARTVGDERSVLMGVRHRDRPHFGVQFHPESILTGEVEADEGEGGTDGGERRGADRSSLAVGKQLVAQFCRLAAEATDGGAVGGNGGSNGGGTER